MKRNILSVVAGLAAAFITFMIVETINSKLYPAPSALNFSDVSAVKNFYSDQPLSFWLIVLLGWMVGSFLCGLVIKAISKNEDRKLPMIADGILTLSAVANFFALPHPTWFIIIGLLIFFPSTILGHKLFKINNYGIR